VLGTSRLYDGHDSRLSYVVWHEEALPYLAVELLSPGSDAEDLGLSRQKPGQPPTKWTVYEQILGIPYYAVFNRYNDKLRCFQLENGRYREVELPRQRLWLPEAGLGLGLWFGEYEWLPRSWLRFYDRKGRWLLTPVERERHMIEQESQRAETERQWAERLAAKLKALGIDPEE